MPDFPGTARDDGAAFVIGNKAYCVTGMEVGWQCTRNGAVFDGSTETWGTISDLPFSKERQYGSSFSSGGFAYVFGGVDCSGNYLNDLWRYDPTNDSWLNMLSLPDTGRSGASCFIIGDTAYIVGGKNNVNQALSEVWAYSLTGNTWKKKNNFPAGCWRGCGFAIDTLAYVCFGSSDNGTYLREMYKYNHLQDTWDVVPGISLPPRTHVGCAVVYQKAGLFGGQDSAGTLANELLEFDPASQQITIHPGPSAGSFRGGMAFSLNNMFYYTTGLDYTLSRQKQTWRSSHVMGINTSLPIDNQIRIFPQPCTDNITIRSSSKQIISLHLFDFLGKNIIHIPDVYAMEEIIEMHQLIPGIYYLQIELEDGCLFSEKIIKTP